MFAFESNGSKQIQSRWNHISAQKISCFTGFCYQISFWVKCRVTSLWKKIPYFTKIHLENIVRISLHVFFFRLTVVHRFVGIPNGFHPSLRMPFQVTTFGRVLEEHPEMTGSLNRKIAMSKTKKSTSGQVPSMKSWFMKFTCFFSKKIRRLQNPKPPPSVSIMTHICSVSTGWTDMARYMMYTYP